MRQILLSSHSADEKSEEQRDEEMCLVNTAHESPQDQTGRKQLKQVWNLDQPGSRSLFYFCGLGKKTKKQESLETLSRD